MNVLPIAFAGFPGGMEWIIIGLIALLLFGKRLPATARSLGSALSEFKSGLNGIKPLEGGESVQSNQEKHSL